MTGTKRNKNGPHAFDRTQGMTADSFGRLGASVESFNGPVPALMIVCTSVVVASCFEAGELQ